MTAFERITRFFFMHLGSLVAVIVYFNLCGASGYSPEGVRAALLTALIVKCGYMAIAYWQGEHKRFDFAIFTMFAVGTAGAYLGIDPLFELYRVYSPAILFFTLALASVVPLVLGREPFTYYYARRQLPRWQLKTREFYVVSRVMALYWTLIFLIAAALCLHAPRDPLYTFLFPNLLVFLVGIPAQFWLPPLFFRLFPPKLPRSIEPLIMAMPMTFNPKAAGDVRASIQFNVTGPEAGAYWLRIGGGKCESFEGVTDAPDLTVDTPDTVWVRIVHGELDGARALADGLYRVKGDALILTKLGQWFAR